MADLLRFLFSSYCVIIFTGCGEQKERESLQERLAKDLYFSEESAASLSDYPKDSASFTTDYLKQFEDDPIAWQPWNQSVKDKALACQTPILLVVVSSTTESCRETLDEVYEQPKLLNKLRNHNLCTIVDVHACPEIGILVNRLCVETNQAVSFPSFIWMSHEALPIASIALGNTSGKKLASTIINASEMVKDIWSKSSDYAVNNSRDDNEARQNQLDATLRSKNDLFLLEEEEDSSPVSRCEKFKRSTRQLISYYDPISRNLDGLGGIIPSNALDLISRASVSPLISKQQRAYAKRAFSELSDHIITSAALDPLDGDYFQGRRGRDWDLCIFSKQLDHQAQFATALIRGGQLFNNTSLLNEGLRLSNFINNNWIKKNISIRAPRVDSIKENTFLWQYDKLAESLSAEEFNLVKTIYGVRPQGNIPATTDPAGTYYKLNALNPRTHFSTIAAKLNISEQTLKEQLAPALAKLKKIREKSEIVFEESTIPIYQLSHASLSFHAAWAATGESKFLDSAKKIALRIEENHLLENGQLARFATPATIKARAIDYASFSLACLYLYQATLDENWLAKAEKIIEEAESQLSRPGFPLTEISKEDQIIGLYLHNFSMIFGESSLGLMDQVYTRLFAITNDTKYAQERGLIARFMGDSIRRAPVIHTDILSSFALGDSPLSIVVTGNQNSLEYTHSLRKLNAPRFLSLATIATPSASGVQRDFPPHESAAVTYHLIQNGKVISSVANLEKLSAKLHALMAKKE